MAGPTGPVPPGLVLSVDLYEWEMDNGSWITTLLQLEVTWYKIQYTGELSGNKTPLGNCKQRKITLFWLLVFYFGVC